MAVLASLDQGGSALLLPAPIQNFGAQIAETYIPGASAVKVASQQQFLSKMTHFPRTSQPDIRSRAPLEALVLRPASGRLARFPTTRASSRTHYRLNSVHTPGTICQWAHSDQPSLIDAHLGITSTSMLRPRLTRSTDIASLPFHVTLVVCISNSFIFIVVPSIDAEMNTRFTLAYRQVTHYIPRWTGSIYPRPGFYFSKQTFLLCAYRRADPW